MNLTRTTEILYDRKTHGRYNARPQMQHLADEHFRLSDDKYQPYRRMKFDLREIIDRVTIADEKLRFYDEFAKKY